MLERIDNLAAIATRGAAGPTPAPDATAPARSPRRALTILIASARQSLVACLRVAVATAGIGLMVSPDGLHAVMSAVRQPPQLVILDDDLPGVDAAHVEQLLAQDARTAHIRVVHIK